MHITVDEAVEKIKSGQIVGLPTDTVYGIGAAVHNERAVEEIYQTKGRSKEKALLILVANLSQVLPLIDEHPEGLRLFSEAFWPGGLTLVLQARPEQVPSIVRAGQPTAGFRVPEHPLTRELLERVGPLAAPSANMSGKDPANSPEAVEAAFGESFPVIDGGESKHGVPSTILAHEEGGWRILRPGAVARRDIELIAEKANLKEPIR